jgi:hypothetical protein
MKIYLTTADAVNQLRKNGFINDFRLSGNCLLWLQEGISIPAEKFYIPECHRIINAKNNMDECTVFCIIAPCFNIKGILVNHYGNYPKLTPPIIINKLAQLNTYTG